MYQRKVCQHCEAFFNGRRNQIYCSANCRKRYSEPAQNSLNSREKKNRNMRLIDSASRIAELYFTRPPFERLGMMRGYIALAKQGNGKMREILSNEYLLDRKNNYGNPFKGKRGKSFGSLAQACEEYCQYYWNASAREVVYNIAADPDDGVID